MAAKGTAAKSASGASISKYDVEVESRLKALEKAVKELQSHSHEGDTTVDGGVLDVVKKIDEVLTNYPRIEYP